MATRTSRRKLAEHVADRLASGDINVIRELAALIIIEKRERELDLIVGEIEAKLADRGILIATVETATPLTDKIRQEIADILGYSEVELREIVKPELTGGIRVRTPSAMMDETVIQKLHTLKSRKI